MPGAECVFCDIVAGASPADLVLDDAHAVAFLDRRPLFPGHVLVVPRRHVVTLVDLAVDELAPLFERVQWCARALVAELGADGTFVANNNVVSQSVAHLHVHVVPRRHRDGLRGFFWPRQHYEPGESAATATRIARAIESIRGPAPG